MAKRSAGILLYRRRDAALEVFLVHPGSAFWARKDNGAWSIPKGEVEPGEEPFARAKREFIEEIGFDIEGVFKPLDPVRQAGGKVVHAWAIEGDADPDAIRSNTFTMEWPPLSGRIQEFPEVDRAQWFDLDAARRKINIGQRALVDQLCRLVGKAQTARD
jgi:predicted NUDIX family NTP pyrophosphohydrolase